MKASNSARRVIEDANRGVIARKVPDKCLGDDSESDRKGNPDGGSERDGRRRTMRLEVSLPHYRCKMISERQLNYLDPVSILPCKPLLALETLFGGAGI